MSSARSALIALIPDLDLSNYSITNQLAYFLEEVLMDGEISELSKELAADDAGHCQGLTTLVLYALWLETQPLKEKDVARDDWTWLQKTVQNLIAWDSESEAVLSHQDKKDFERLLYHVEFFQNTSNYLQVAEGDLHQSLSDTKNRSLNMDYAISGLFHLTDLYKPLVSGLSLIEELMAPNNLVVIGSEYHVVGVIRLNNAYYFYDSQYSPGSNLQIIPLNQFKKIATHIFQSLHKNEQGEDLPDDYTTLDFRVFSFEPLKQYRTKKDFLSQTQAVQNGDILLSYNNIFNLSAKMGDVDSIAFYQSVLGDERTVFRLREQFEGYTALHHSVINGRLMAARLLLQNGSYSNQLTDNGEGSSPLYLASSAGSTSVMQLLLENYADIDLSNRGGNKAIHVATLKNRREAMWILYEWGADIDATNYLQQTPLLMAVKDRNIDMVRLLLHMNADVNKADAKGYTPLHWAVYHNNVELVRLLIEYDADLSARLRTKTKKTPLQLAQDNAVIHLLQVGKAVASVSMERTVYPLVSRLKGIREKNIEKAKAFFHLTMNNEIKPDIVFKNTGMINLTAPEALYIEAIHELFQERESIDLEECKTILLRINNFLKDKELVSFIDIPEDEVSTFLKHIAPILGNKSDLHKRIVWQKKANYSLELFKKECQDLEIDNLHIGGVYGRACVWDAARQLAMNIYAKNIGDKHPNIRYADTEDRFQFKNAYIDDTITQGFMRADADIFHEFVLFPQHGEAFYLEHLSMPGRVEDFEDGHMVAPDEIGANYDKYYSEVNAAEQHEKLVNEMKSLLFSNPLRLQKDAKDQNDQDFERLQGGVLPSRGKTGLFQSSRKKQKLEANSPTPNFKR